MTALLVLLLCGAVVWSGLATAVFLKEEFAQEPGPADCVIVLGARVMPNGSLSTALLRRVEKALEVYEAGLAPAIIVCGAQGSDEPVDEATAMKEYLVSRGVPEEDVFADPDSRNTRENLANARAIMRENGMESAIVVTNAYHVARAKAIAGDLGIQALGASARMPRGLYIPWKMRIREALSWINYLVRYRK